MNYMIMVAPHLRQITDHSSSSQQVLVVPDN